MTTPRQPLARRVLLSLWLLLAAVCRAGDIGEERRAELMNLLVQDCGSCHGLTMKGGLGPALLPQDLADKNEDALVATILFGRPGTAMPPWAVELSEEEARWMLRQLKEGLDGS